MVPEKNPKIHLVFALPSRSGRIVRRSSEFRPFNGHIIKRGIRKDHQIICHNRAVRLRQFGIFMALFLGQTL